MPAKPGGRAGEAARQWYLQHPIVGAEPVRTIRAATKVRAVIGAEIGVRHDAEIDEIAEIVQDLRGGGADAVAAGLVDDRPGAERGIDGSGQHLDLAAFQPRLEVAGIGIARVDRFVMGRVHPGVKMGADQAEPGVVKLPQGRDRYRSGRDGIIDDIGGDEAETGENVLRLVLGGDGRDGHVAAMERGVPVEFLLRVDDDLNQRRSVRQCTRLVAGREHRR